MNHRTKKRKNNKKKYNKKRKYRINHSRKKYITKGGARNIFQANHIIDVLNHIKTIGIDNDLDYELCGTIEIVRNKSYKYELLLHDKTLESTSSTRLSCNYEKYSNIIWHTHPHISKFFPSIEDILKVIKLRPKNIIKDSYIVTGFGIWQLSSINYIKIDDDDDDDIRKNIQQILDNLYWNTSRGREYESNAINTAINELNDLLENILNVNFFTYPL